MGYAFTGSPLQPPFFLPPLDEKNTSPILKKKGDHVNGVAYLQHPQFRKWSTATKRIRMLRLTLA